MSLITLNCIIYFKKKSQKMLRNSIHIFSFLVMLFISLNISAQNADFTFDKIVIDAGHGGKDPGATIGGVFEKDIVLDVALKTGEMIKKKFPELKIIYTRDKDVFIPLNERADIANKQKADLFISIHVNACPKNTILGAETYILGQHRSQENLDVAKMENSVILLEDDYSTRYEGFDPNQAESYIMFEMIQNEFLEQSRLFADKVQKNIVSLTDRKDRGVRQAGFLVLRRTSMPSALIELGFLSNESERKYLVTEKGKSLMAQSIFTAISDYKQRFDGRNTKPSHAADKTSSSKSQSKPQKAKDENVDLKESTDQNTSNISTQNTEPLDQNQLVTPDSLVDVSSLVGQWYGIQIMSINVKYDKCDSIFKNHSPVYYLSDNGFYKYFLNVSQNSKEVLGKSKELRAIFPGSFPVGFFNGKRTSFKQAK